MKHNILTFALLALTISSCTKDRNTNPLQLAEDDGCINRIVIPVTSQGTMTNCEYSLVKNLFITNSINFQNFRFSRTYRDSAQYAIGIVDERSVHVIQYIKGLTTFIESLNYLFINQSFHHRSGELINGTTLDTVPVLKLPQLRKLFIDDLQRFDMAGTQYKDSCLNAEFGYLILNSGIPNTSEHLVKVWHLTPKFNSYPEAWYQDNSGKRIGYSYNGILTFK